MGNAAHWQTRMVDTLAVLVGTVLNPPRDDWDIEANVVAVYFDPDTQSPITLMELRILATHAQHGRDVIVCCPEGLYRLFPFWGCPG